MSEILHEEAGTVYEGYSRLIRLRYNTMANETPGGKWVWRVVLTRLEGRGYEEVLVKSLLIWVSSFSLEDDMPVVGRKWHIACYGKLVVCDGNGIIDGS